MLPRIPETDRKPGVFYAITDDGLELPIIDITHPAFAFDVSAEQLNALIEQFVATLKHTANAPLGAMQAAAQQSILVRAMLESADTYTTGVMTYLQKLEPEHLGAGYAGPLDRQWAATLTPVTFRWRMRHVIRLLADGLIRAAAARPGMPVVLLNIGGGPSVDSLNALIVVQHEQPDLLAGRRVRIHVLDIDAEGPHFGARALAALQAEGGPLHGVDARLLHTPYDWADTAPLERLIAELAPERAVVVASTEGALFEYATDAQIVANLAALRPHTPADMIVVGPVIRDASTLDPRLRVSEHVPGRPAVRYIGLAHFGALAAQAGWTIARSMDGPMHQVVCLEKCPA